MSVMGSPFINAARPGRYMSGTSMLIAAVALVAVVVGLAASVWPRDEGAAGLLFVLGVLLTIPVVVATARGRFDPLESVYFFLAVFAYTYFIKPAMRLSAGEPFRFGEASLHSAIAVSIVGLVAFCVGYYSGSGPLVARYVPTMEGELSGARQRICAWALIAVGAAGLWTYMEISGGWREFWSMPHGYGGKADLTTAYVYQLPELMIVGFFVMVQELLSRPRTDPAAVMRTLLASVGGVGVYTILWGRRTFVIWVLVTLFLLYYLRRQRPPKAVTLFAFGLVVFAAVALTLAYRSHFHLDTSLEDIQAVDPTTTAFSTISQPGDEFDSYLAIVELYPDRIDHDYFWLYAQIPLHPIPRLVWPEKPELFVSSWDDLLAKSGVTTGASESILGDLYIQLGVVGVALGMFVIGVVWRFFYAYLYRAPHSDFMQLLYAVAIGNVPSLILQGGVSALWKWMPFMIPGIVLTFLISRRRRIGVSVSPARLP